MLRSERGGWTACVAVDDVAQANNSIQRLNDFPSMAHISGMGLKVVNCPARLLKGSLSPECMYHSELRVCSWTAIYTQANSKEMTDQANRKAIQGGKAKLHTVRCAPSCSYI
ncbi:hypothetical protein VPH35_068051 [Triticum aestivum]